MRAVTLLLSAIVITACGGPLKFTVPSSAAAPGADAKIVADVSEEQNQTQLAVEVSNLAPASRVKEGMSSYTAWYRRDSNASWARIGGLEYDADSRAGKVSGSVPERAFDFEITAEASEGPASPSSSVVFSQRIAE